MDKFTFWCVFFAVLSFTLIAIDPTAGAWMLYAAGSIFSVMAFLLYRERSREERMNERRESSPYTME